MVGEVRKVYRWDVVSENILTQVPKYYLRCFYSVTDLVYIANIDRIRIWRTIKLMLCMLLIANFLSHALVQMLPCWRLPVGPLVPSPASYYSSELPARISSLFLYVPSRFGPCSCPEAVAMGVGVGSSPERYSRVRRFVSGISSEVKHPHSMNSANICIT